MSTRSTSTPPHGMQPTPPRVMRAVVPTGYFGSECDGGFSEYTVVDARHVHRVVSALSDAELATLATSYMTAENMLNRAEVQAATCPLHDLVAAQEAFIAKRHIGNIVVTMTTDS